MDRLTARDSKGNAYYIKCFGPPCNGLGMNTCSVCSQTSLQGERLAAYEDTGLTPDQINALHRPSDTAQDIMTKICDTYCKHPDQAAIQEDIDHICDNCYLAELIQSAADKNKENPIKPIKNNLNVFSCAVCGRDVFENVENYCAICGQKLNWETEDTDGR